LTALGQVATEAVPSAFGLDPSGQFVVAAGTVTGRLAVYRVQGKTGDRPHRRAL
jgi:6-phosphogluconolactonase